MKIQDKYSVSDKVLKMIHLDQGEEILYYLSGFPTLTCFIKGTREVIIKFVVTNRHIIFLDYYRLNVRKGEGPRVKYSVSLSDIARVEGKIDKIGFSAMPCLEVVTLSGESYQLFFSNFGKKKHYIKEIANFIGKANPRAEMQMALPDPANWWAQPGNDRK